MPRDARKRKSKHQKLEGRRRGVSTARGGQEEIPEAKTEEGQPHRTDNPRGYPCPTLHPGWAGRVNLVTHPAGLLGKAPVTDPSLHQRGPR